jgi:hypothetical protein
MTSKLTTLGPPIKLHHAAFRFNCIHPLLPLALRMEAYQIRPVPPVDRLGVSWTGVSWEFRGRNVYVPFVTSNPVTSNQQSPATGWASRLGPHFLNASRRFVCLPITRTKSADHSSLPVCVLRRIAASVAWHPPASRYPRQLAADH